MASTAGLHYRGRHSRIGRIRGLLGRSRLSPIRNPAGAPLPGWLGLALVPAAAALGWIAVGSTHWALGLIGLLGLLLVYVVGGVRALTGLFVALLPWVAAFTGTLPHLTATVIAAGALGFLWLVAEPKFSAGPGTAVIIIGALWATSAVVTIASSASSYSKALEAGHYALCLAMAFLALCATKRRELERFALILMASSVGAMALQIVFQAAGVGVFRRAGEYSGFTNTPHELAFVGATVAAAVALVRGHVLLRCSAFALAIIATLQTGVRTALAGLALVLLYYLLKSGYRLRVLGVLAVAAVLVVATGADQRLIHRFETSQVSGEFSSLATAGSGRGELWSVAIDHMRADGAKELTFGSGLYSQWTIEERAIGAPRPTQSDFFQLALELGLVGLVGLLLLWGTLARSKLNKAPLLIFLAYALINGGIDYTTAIVTVFLFAALPSPDLEPGGTPGEHLADARSGLLPPLPEGELVS